MAITLTASQRHLIASYIDCCDDRYDERAARVKGAFDGTSLQIGDFKQPDMLAGISADDAFSLCAWLETYTHDTYDTPGERRSAVSLIVKLLMSAMKFDQIDRWLGEWDTTGQVLIRLGKRLRDTGSRYINGKLVPDEVEVQGEVSDNTATTPAFRIASADLNRLKRRSRALDRELACADCQAAIDSFSFGFARLYERARFPKSVHFEPGVCRC